MKNLLTEIKRVYPGDSFRVAFETLSGVTCYLLFKRLEPFDDNLSSMSRYRIVIPRINRIQSADTEEEVISLLTEFGVSADTLDTVISDLAVEASMLVHMKHAAMVRHLGEPYTSQGKVKYLNIYQKFEEAKDDSASLGKWVAQLLTEKTIAPSLKVVEETDET